MWEQIFKSDISYMERWQYTYGSRSKLIVIFMPVNNYSRIECWIQIWEELNGNKVDDMLITDEQLTFIYNKKVAIKDDVFEKIKRGEAKSSALEKRKLD